MEGSKQKSFRDYKIETMEDLITLAFTEGEAEIGEDQLKQISGGSAGHDFNWEWLRNYGQEGYARA